LFYRINLRVFYWSDFIKVHVSLEKVIKHLKEKLLFTKQLLKFKKPRSNKPKTSFIQHKENSSKGRAIQVKESCNDLSTRQQNKQKLV
jgi:hypothetical protein